MNCPRVEELILDALDEPLGAEERAQVDAHLATCPTCVASLRGYVATIGLVRELGRLDASEAAPPLSDALVRRILEARTAARDDRDARRTG
jgi:anti-sigma factor RsiW